MKTEQTLQANSVELFLVRINLDLFCIEKAEYMRVRIGKIFQTISLYFVIVLILSYLVSAAQADTSNNLVYNFYLNGVIITGYTSSPTTLSIPTTINGYKVLAIGNSAFKGCTSLTSVTILT